MSSEYDVYLAFRKAQAQFNSRPYRLPKDFEKFIETRMSEKNRECITQAARFFDTKWSNVDVDRFMECGFKLFGKSFTYTKFFNSRLMLFYAESDKNRKRVINANKKTMLESAKFVKKFIIPVRDGNYGLIEQYCRMKEGNKSIPVEHYVKSNIDEHFLVWLISKKYLVLTDSDRALIPYIVEKYREYVENLNEMRQFLTKMESLL